MTMPTLVHGFQLVSGRLGGSIEVLTEAVCFR
jgi:hypothetical protein